jgi:23S rRNA pseudouridine2605 synthase
MVLPKGLRRGEWMELDEHDIAALSKASSTSFGKGRAEQSQVGAGTPAKRSRSQVSEAPKPKAERIGADSLQRQRKKAQQTAAKRRR